MRQQQLFLLNGRQGLGNDLGPGLAEAAFAGTAEIVGRIKKGEEHRRLLLQCGLRAEVIARQIGKAEFLVGCKFPGHVQLDRATQIGSGSHKSGGRRRLKAQKLVGGLDLDAFAAVEFDLGRSVGL